MYNNGAQVQEILEWSIAVIICLFIITLLLLWYSKERTEKYAKELNSFTIKYKNIFLHTSFTEAVAQVTSLTKIERDGMIAAYRELACSDNYDISNKLIAILSSSDAIPYYIEKAKSRYPEKRLYAYLQLNRIGLPGLKDFFFEAADNETKKNNNGKLSAACLLSVAKLSVSHNDITKLVHFIRSNGKIARGLQEGLIIQAGNSVKSTLGEAALVEEIAILLKTIDYKDAIYSSLISAVGKLRLSTMSAQINDVYSHIANNETDDLTIIKIACLRALSGLDLVENNIHSLKVGFLDRDWRVRATACTSAGILRVKEISDILYGLLGDPAYYVRLNAARALLQVGAKEQLERVVNNIISVNDIKKEADPFRSSVCRYVLAEESRDV